MEKIATIICCIFSVLITSAQLPSLQQKAILVKRTIELNHYSPRQVDDSFSFTLFKKMINTLDSRGLFFTASDYRSLSAYKYKLDDELKGNGWYFLDGITSTYKRALARVDSIINALMSKPMDFTTNETIGISPGGDINFADSREEMISRWRRYMKLRVLTNIYDFIDQDSIDNTMTKEKIDQYETAIRTRIRNSEIKNIKRIIDYPGGVQKYMSEIYLNAIATSFDPHTNYFSPEGKEDFQSQLSSEGLSYGLEFDKNEKDQIIISHLVPGGPAWKSGELHKGDIVLQLNIENKEAIDAADLDLDEIYDIIDQPGNFTMAIKTKKTNNDIVSVTLGKEKIANEENVVRSFILEADKRIGYILLPGFYTQWENEQGSGCANDVAREIIKLKREKIDGLIVDVRFNGGGSMGEGLDMTGIFVDEGPLAGEKDAKGKITYFKDQNRGVIYDGPLILMVNRQSASASEMLAGSLQDYHRAIILGSSTYGKASVQQIFPIDTSGKKIDNSQFSSSDVLKITIGKFFRLDGHSAQINGIKPDIKLPDAFDDMHVGERFYVNALPSDTIQKNNYYRPLKSLPVNELAKKSAERVSNNKDFQSIVSINRTRSEMNSKGIEAITLKWDSF